MTNEWLSIIENTTNEQIAEYLAQLESERDYFETSLRDTFAAHALQGLLSNSGGYGMDYVALAYEYADNMLTERSTYD